MTQFKYVSEAEMRKETGVKNALGYTFPEQDKILLKKGLKGKRREEVIDHEMNHLRKGEEGPFWGAVAGAAMSYLGSKKQAGAARDAAAQSAADTALARGYYEPYRNIGESGASSLMDYIYGGVNPSEEQTSELARLQSEHGKTIYTPTLDWRGKRTDRPEQVDNTAKINALQDQIAGTRTGGAGFSAKDPTMEEVMASPGYQTRMGALENSAAAKGSLFSGNALRNISQFGESEFDAERARRQQNYQQELSNIMALTGVGERAAGGSAGMTMQGSNALQNLTMQRGAAQAQPYQFGAGLAGQYQGQQNYMDMLKQFQKG